MILRRSFSIAFVSCGLACALAFGTMSGLLPVQAKAASGAYAIDPDHTTVMFRVKHLNTSWTFGCFRKVAGEFDVNPSSPEKSTFHVTIDASSLDTGKSERDSHLKSPDFLDVKQFPEITLLGKGVKKAGSGKYTVDGELTLHGVKKPISVELEEIGTSESQFGVRAGYFGTFTVQRSEFGIKFMPGDVGEEVQITVSIEGLKAAAKSK